MQIYKYNLALTHKIQVQCCTFTWKKLDIMLRFISISLLLYLSLFLSCTTFFSQSCQKVLLIGKVVDTLKANQFYNLMIINQSTGKGVFGQPDGSFQVYAGVNDSILLSIRS